MADNAPGKLREVPKPHKSAKVIEVSVSASAGAKIQIVQYQYHADFHHSFSEKYALEGYTDDEAEQFRVDKLRNLKTELEPINQEAIDELTELRDRLRDG
jgi:hypothetical protein